MWLAFRSTVLLQTSTTASEKRRVGDVSIAMLDRSDAQAELGKFLKLAVIRARHVLSVVRSGERAVYRGHVRVAPRR